MHTLASGPRAESDIANSNAHKNYPASTASPTTPPPSLDQPTPNPSLCVKFFVYLLSSWPWATLLARLCDELLEHTHSDTNVVWVSDASIQSKTHLPKFKHLKLFTNSYNNSKLIYICKTAFTLCNP